MSYCFELWIGNIFNGIAYVFSIDIHTSPICYFQKWSLIQSDKLSIHTYFAQKGSVFHLFCLSQSFIQKMQRYLDGYKIKYVDIKAKDIFT